MMTIEPVRKSIEVSCRQHEAFRLFFDQMDTWWPLATHSVGGDRARSCVFEGRVGGTIHEIDDDGTVHLWGTVTEWRPPDRVIFTWHPGRDASTAQEIELRFVASGDGTRVELEHRRWDVLGDRAEQTRNTYQTGWDPVLEAYIARTGA
jgi:uncharacterized protein YndB with AHSA1/START domain